MDKVFVVTAKNVVHTDMISFKFLFDAKAPRELYRDLASVYGLLHLREKGDDEIDIFKAVRGEPGAVGPNGIKKWEAFLGSRGSFAFTGNANEAPPDEAGLKELLKDMQDCALLMRRDLFDRFLKACEELGIHVDFFHYDGDLSTS